MQTTTTNPELGEAIAALHRAIDTVHAAVDATAEDGAGMAAVVDLLRGADRCAAAAVGASMTMTHRGVIASEGLTSDTYLRMSGRTARETSGHGYLVERLTDMPVLYGWYRDGDISTGVVRELSWLTRNLTRAQRAWVDANLGEHAEVVRRLDADDLVDAVARLVDRARPDLRDARERRERECGRRVVIQPRLDGGGLAIADLNDEDLAATIQALDSPRTTNANGEDDAPEDGVLGTRQQRAHGVQRARGENFMAMVHHRNADRCPANHTTCSCHQPATAADNAGEGAEGEDVKDAAGDSGASAGEAAGAEDPGTAAEDARAEDVDATTASTAPGDATAGTADSNCARVGWAPSQAQPSFLILTPIEALADPAHPSHTTAQLLARRAGGPVNLSDTAVQRLLCQGSLRLIFTHNNRVVAASPTIPKVPASLAAMVAARDGHCRFPGCRMPAPLCDLHHLVPRSHRGASVLTNLALICSQHHHAIHDGGWTNHLHPDGRITFTRRGITKTTVPYTHRWITPTTEPPKGRPRRRVTHRHRTATGESSASLTATAPRGHPPDPAPPDAVAADHPPEPALPF